MSLINGWRLLNADPNVLVLETILAANAGMVMTDEDI